MTYIKLCMQYSPIDIRQNTCTNNKRGERKRQNQYEAGKHNSIL